MATTFRFPYEAGQSIAGGIERRRLAPLIQAAMTGNLTPEQEQELLRRSPELYQSVQQIQRAQAEEKRKEWQHQQMQGLVGRLQPQHTPGGIETTMPDMGAQMQAAITGQQMPGLGGGLEIMPGQTQMPSQSEMANVMSTLAVLQGQPQHGMTPYTQMADIGLTEEKTRTEAQRGNVLAQEVLNKEAERHTIMADANRLAAMADNYAAQGRLNEAKAATEEIATEYAPLLQQAELALQQAKTAYERSRAGSYDALAEQRRVDTGVKQREAVKEERFRERPAVPAKEWRAETDAERGITAWIYGQGGLPVQPGGRWEGIPGIRQRQPDIPPPTTRDEAERVLASYGYDPFDTEWIFRLLDRRFGPREGGKTIKVISPDGKEGVIPIADWAEAQKAGYKRK